MPPLSSMVTLRGGYPAGLWHRVQMQIRFAVTIGIDYQCVVKASKHGSLMVVYMNVPVEMIARLENSE